MNADNKVINSHVQLPKGILKHFVDSSQRTFYLDLNSGKIGLAGARKLGTEPGYFSERQEQYLSSEIEGPLCSLADQIRRFIDSEESELTLSLASELVFKKYITAAMARSELAMQSFFHNSETACLFSKQDNHDHMVFFSTHHNQGISTVIKDHQLSVIVNKTDMHLVVPRNCYYTIYSEGVEMIVAPVSPVCALCLVPPGSSSKQTLLPNHTILLISKQEDISLMNTRALLLEYTINRKFLASSTKMELELLRDYMIKNRDFLESSYKANHSFE